jgi:hypothetical protein
MINLNLDIKLHSYIAHPYWPERERIINIIKESGMSRARSTANRQKALDEYLQSHDMTQDDFKRMQELADRPFYTAGDWIIVPSLHVMSMIVNTCMTIRSAGRPCPPEQARSAMRAGDWRTDRTRPDGVWERFAVVTAGTGTKLSNQRALRSNPYIGTPPDAMEGKGVTASGIISIDESAIKTETLEAALRWAGTSVGIGASRKMGWGRFEVVSLM